MKKISKIIKELLSGLFIILVLVAVFKAGAFYNRISSANATAESVENDEDEFDLQLPGEVENM